MTPEVAYFLDHAWGMAGTIAAVFVAYRQSMNRRTIVIEIRDNLRNDLQNGVGDRIAAKAVEQMTPVLHEAATVAADKIVQVAINTANDLAANKTEGWDGADRRTGAADRRTGPPDRRGTE